MCAAELQRGLSRPNTKAALRLASSLPVPHLCPSAGRPGLTLVPLGGNSLSDYKQVLGPQHQSYKVERQPGERKISFYVEGLTFPDADFLGLVSLSVSLVDTEVCMALGAGSGAEALGDHFGGSSLGMLGVVVVGGS